MIGIVIGLKLSNIFGNLGQIWQGNLDQMCQQLGQILFPLIGRSHSISGGDWFLLKLQTLCPRCFKGLLIQEKTLTKWLSKALVLDRNNPRKTSFRAGLKIYKMDLKVGLSKFLPIKILYSPTMTL